MKKILAILFIILLVSANGINNILADEAKETTYSYTITFDGGQYGTVVDNKGNEVTSITIVPGSEDQKNFDPNQYSVRLKNPNDKYYFKGFHISGRMDEKDDIFVPIDKESLTVDQDYDLVATYGIKSNQVEYHIRYLDENGVEIGPKLEVLYANALDYVPVTCRYIEGYTPITSKIEGEESTQLPLDGHIKEFRFRYRTNTPGETVVIDEGTTIYVYEPRTIYTGGPGGVEVIEAVEIDDNPTPQALPDNNNNNNNNNNENNNQNGPGQGEIEIIDNNPPLANWFNQLLETSPILAYLIIGLAAIFGISLIAFLIFLFRRKRRDNE